MGADLSACGNVKKRSAGQMPAPTCYTSLASFAYVLGQILSIFAYDLGRKSRSFAYDLGKHCTFAKNESYDIQTINRRFREVESASQSQTTCAAWRFYDKINCNLSA